MKRRHVTEADLDSIGTEPKIGEVWWCQGESLGFADGGKVRPVLVIELLDDQVRVMPLTTKKPNQNPISVAHNAGTSWLTHSQIFVPRMALLSNLGDWTGFTLWRMKRPGR